MADQGFREGLKLLRQRDVSRLFASYLITYTGTAMAPIAVAFGVLELTGSTADTAYVIAAPTVSSIAILLLGGVLADRTSRQRLIVLAEFLSMASQLTIAALFLSGDATVPVLTALMLVNGAALALNVPASTGLITQIVDRDQLQSVNALLGTARNGAMAGGAALGGVLVATVGAGATLAIDAVSFGVSALLVMTMRPTLQAAPEKASVLQDLRLGWREFISHTWLWVIVVQFSLLVAVMESTMGLLGPAVAREYMDGARDWGFIAASFGVGTLVGGILSMKVRPKYPMRFATLCTFSFCLMKLTLAVPLALPVIAFAGFVEGVLGQMFGVIWYTTLQQKIPSHLLSRVSAYDHLGSIALAPLGIVVAGFLFEAIGYRSTLLASAAVVIVASTAAIAVRDVRMMTSE